MAGGSGRTGLVLGVVAAVLVALGVGVWLIARTAGTGGNDSTSGNVLVYDGRTYWVSGERVRAGALGEVVATGVPYQDTNADLRAITGFAPDVALAAYIPPQRAGQTGPGWTFVAVDQKLGTDPLSDRVASTILEP